ncbi:MAG: nitrite/sulfite reductase [Bulleidia sp.]
MTEMNWKADLPAFKEKTDAFYAGELSMKDYKGFSGFYGSYSQKGGKASMLRLRMPCGIVSKEKLGFVLSQMKTYGISRCHFTTCQTIQLHDLSKEQLYPVMENALDFGIIVMGGGGDFPRNVMCSPLSGVEQNEYFDVRPYANAASDYLLTKVKDKKMPRKLKVCFSNSAANVPHATFRDLGFAANANGKFDVYCAGGLGNNPRFGVCVDKGVDPSDILYYIEAMRMTFYAHGNYENRAKARTRYMVEAVGGEEPFRQIFLENLKAAKDMDLSIRVTTEEITKTGDGTTQGLFVIPQKQEGLYSVNYHPKGGCPSIDVLNSLYETIKDMKDVELRLSPDESCYIINLTAVEAEKVQAVLSDNAASLFETSVACIGASTCQVGLRDSQALLSACIEAVRSVEIAPDALPQIHISGCPSSCGTHQIGSIGFRGHVKVVDKKPLSAFMLFVGGNDAQGSETMGKELGAITEAQIPEFLVTLGKAVTASGMSYAEWFKADPAAIDSIAAPYIA